MTEKADPVVEKCSERYGDKDGEVCRLPKGHAGAHQPCEHRDEAGPTLYYFHDGSRCTQCGAFV